MLCRWHTSGKGHIIVSLSSWRGTSCQLVLRQQRRGCTSQKLENQLWPCLESNQTSPLNIGVLPLIRKVWFSNLKFLGWWVTIPQGFPLDYMPHRFHIVVWTISFPTKGSPYIVSTHLQVISTWFSSELSCSYEFRFLRIRGLFQWCFHIKAAI